MKKVQLKESKLLNQIKAEVVQIRNWRLVNLIRTISNQLLNSLWSKHKAIHFLIFITDFQLDLLRKAWLLGNNQMVYFKIEIKKSRQTQITISLKLTLILINQSLQWVNSHLKENKKAIQIHQLLSNPLLKSLLILLDKDQVKLHQTMIKLSKWGRDHSQLIKEKIQMTHPLKKLSLRRLLLLKFFRNL